MVQPDPGTSRRSSPPQIEKVEPFPQFRQERHVIKDSRLDVDGIRQNAGVVRGFIWYLAEASSNSSSRVECSERYAVAI